MEKTDVIFNHKLDESILRKLAWFRIGLFFCLLPLFLQIFFAILSSLFGINIDGIVSVLTKNINSVAFTILLVAVSPIMFMSTPFGLIVFIWFLSRYKFYLTNKTLEMIANEYKWEYVFSVHSFDHPLSAKESWIAKKIQKHNLYGKIKDASFCEVLIGNACKRKFCLDRIFLYSNDLNNLSSNNIDVKGASVLVPQTPKSFFEGFILNTPAIKDFKNIILVKPKKVSLHKIKDLQKVEIDTQKLFEIYTNNPQTLGQDLSQEFIFSLIDYAKNIDKKITLLITPLGVLAIKKHTSWTGILSPVIFRTIKTQVIKEWQKHENFINLIEIINLLEPKK